MRVALRFQIYVENPVFIKQHSCNLNIDMIGRIDPENRKSGVYHLIGSNRLSQELQDISEELNSKYTKLELDYKFDDPADPNRFFYRSDHYNFAKHNIPVIFILTECINYHKITDTPDKIEYELLAKRTQLIFLTAWELAYRENRLKLDN